MRGLAGVSAALLRLASSQMSGQVNTWSLAAWTEHSPDGAKTDSGVRTQGRSDVIFSPVLTPEESAEEQTSLRAYVFDGINDPNLYPYGPEHTDERVPHADDAISEAHVLPTHLPLFGGTTAEVVRVTTNGIIVLGESELVASKPVSFSSNSIADPIIAGYWNDIWSKKHGRIYVRVEVTNATLLGEVRQDIKEGVPKFTTGGRLDALSYAVIVTFWRVTFYGADKGGAENTFQMLVTTDGYHSFAVLNYQRLEWSQAYPENGHAAAGYSINSQHTALDGSYTAGVLDLISKSTNSDVAGRHILRLDNNPVRGVDDVDDSTDEDGGGDSEHSDDSNDGDNSDDGNGPCLPNENCFEQIWPDSDPDNCGVDNDHGCLGGAIGSFLPPGGDFNGTCKVSFPEHVELFHVFNGHIKADADTVPNEWKVVAANPTFEPGTSGKYQYLIYFKRGLSFSQDQVEWTCTDDGYEYAVGSFPRKLQKKESRTNLRIAGNTFHETVSISFIHPVANFTVDDMRIQMITIDNQNFVLTDIPESGGQDAHEIWFEWDYLPGQFFLSNTVGVYGTD